MKTSNKILITALALPALFAAVLVGRLGVFAFYEQPDYVFFSDADGALAPRTLAEQNFDALDIEGFWKIKIVRGADRRVVVTADAETHRRMQVSVANRTLRLRQTYFSLHGSEQAELAVTMPELRSLRVRGGNEIELAGFQGDRTSIDVRGLTDLKGRACRFDTARLSGVGGMGVDLSACEIVNAKLDFRGLGEVNLYMAGGTLSGRVTPEVGVVHEGTLRAKRLAVYQDDDFEMTPDDGAPGAPGTAEPAQE